LAREKKITLRITCRRQPFGVSTGFDDNPASYFRSGASVLLGDDLLFKIQDMAAIQLH
jgi:hypothetical protein